LYTRLHTNGSLLTESLSRKIIQAGLDRLSFSFDGYDKKTYEKIRIGGNFNKTVNNIIQLLKIKKELRSKKPEVAIEVINFKQLKGEKHREEKEKFLNYFKNLQLDSFVHKELHNWAGEFKKSEELNNFSICTFPWNALVIYWDGSVLPCTQDFFGYNIVGNVKDSSIKEIWNNKKMVYLRKKLALREIKEFKACSNCDRLERKGFLGAPKEYLWKFITKRMP
ncbi:MAG: radical SAM/SPASM domain-containing protein, partial [Candidatus Aminicenantaceae bacterium]